jgi:hypothetical protein
MNGDWNEKLRCLKCGKTGVAALSQGGDMPIVHVVPVGFKVVDTGVGPAFYCEGCDVEVAP